MFNETFSSKEKGDEVRNKLLCVWLITLNIYVLKAEDRGDQKKKQFSSLAEMTFPIIPFHTLPQRPEKQTHAGPGLQMIRKWNFALTARGQRLLVSRIPNMWVGPFTSVSHSCLLYKNGDTPTL